MLDEKEKKYFKVVEYDYNDIFRKLVIDKSSDDEKRVYEKVKQEMNASLNNFVFEFNENAIVESTSTYLKYKIGSKPEFSMNKILQNVNNGNDYLLFAKIILDVETKVAKGVNERLETLLEYIKNPWKVKLETTNTVSKCPNTVPYDFFKLFIFCKMYNETEKPVPIITFEYLNQLVQIDNITLSQKRKFVLQYPDAVNKQDTPYSVKVVSNASFYMFIEMTEKNVALSVFKDEDRISQGVLSPEMFLKQFKYLCRQILQFRYPTSTRVTEKLSPSFVLAFSETNATLPIVSSTLRNLIVPKLARSSNTAQRFRRKRLRRGNNESKQSSEGQNQDGASEKKEEISNKEDDESKQPDTNMTEESEQGSKSKKRQRGSTAIDEKSKKNKKSPKDKKQRPSNEQKNGFKEQDGESKQPKNAAEQQPSDEQKNAVQKQSSESKPPEKAAEPQNSDEQKNAFEEQGGESKQSQNAAEPQPSDEQKNTSEEKQNINAEEKQVNDNTQNYINYIAKLKEEIEELKTQLNNPISDGNNTNPDLEKKIEQLENTIQKLNAEIVLKEEDIASKQKMIESQRDNLTAVQRERDKYENESNDCKNALEIANAQFTTLKNNLAVQQRNNVDLLKKIKEKETELQNIVEKHKAELDFIIKDNIRILTEQRDEINRLEAEKNNLELRLSALIESNGTNTAEIEDYKAQIAQLIATLENLRNEYNKSQAIIRQLQGVVQKSTDEIQQQKNNNEQLEKYNKSLEEKIRKKDALLEQKDAEMKSKQEKIEKEIEDLKAEHKQLQKKQLEIFSQNLQKLIEEKQALEEKIKEVSSNNLDMQKQISTQEKKIRELEKQRDNVAQKLADANKELTKEKNNVTKLEIDSVTQKNDLKKLKEDFKKKEDALKKAQSSRDVATTLFGVLVGMSMKHAPQKKHFYKEITLTT
jgi:hypothetical protein